MNLAKASNQPVSTQSIIQSSDLECPKCRGTRACLTCTPAADSEYRPGGGGGADGEPGCHAENNVTLDIE